MRPLFGTWLSSRSKAIAALLAPVVTVASHYLTGVPGGNDKSIAFIGLTGVLAALGVYGVTNPPGPTPAPAPDASPPAPVSTKADTSPVTPEPAKAAAPAPEPGGLGTPGATPMPPQGLGQPGA